MNTTKTNHSQDVKEAVEASKELLRDLLTKAAAMNPDLTVDTSDKALGELALLAINFGMKGIPSEMATAFAVRLYAAGLESSNMPQPPADTFTSDIAGCHIRFNDVRGYRAFEDGLSVTLFGGDGYSIKDTNEAARFVVEFQTYTAAKIK